MPCRISARGWFICNIPVHTIHKDGVQAGGGQVQRRNISMESADYWVFVLNPLQHLFGHVASQHRSRLVGLN